MDEDKKQTGPNLRSSLNSHGRSALSCESSVVTPMGIEPMFPT
jgi:hypothetical protein